MTDTLEPIEIATRALQDHLHAAYRRLLNDRYPMRCEGWVATIYVHGCPPSVVDSIPRRWAVGEGAPRFLVQVRT